MKGRSWVHTVEEGGRGQMAILGEGAAVEAVGVRGEGSAGCVPFAFPREGMGKKHQAPLVLPPLPLMVSAWFGFEEMDQLGVLECPAAFCPAVLPAVAAVVGFLAG
uniref:Uncharacterized protein n=1 Tax=Chromera velia CCMP2878 TaxID=1169474 RepID=A0A0G4EZL1_9ALVE|eukprot:Cvel_14444.t1-p1 / transcript=Cvel_14444.t1 / gene=Cvel_14444 / organism=Chromera_velia_CCMP2878 / gene_product=hypothetical protein / transcript_product=hypothetical protein / location=Cvel_scaffold1028:16903-17217(+) / protein_length=105 / sequence_SO=supercontig / SO=protein_coding / is_pseudo=false